MIVEKMVVVGGVEYTHSSSDSNKRIVDIKGNSYDSAIDSPHSGRTYIEDVVSIEETKKEHTEIEKELIQCGIKLTKHFDLLDTYEESLEKEILSYDEHIFLMQDIVSRAKFELDEDLLFDIPMAYIPTWRIGEVYEKGQIVKYYGIKYIVKVGRITASSYVYPNTVASRNQYVPLQGIRGLYNWAYGERIVEGMRRQYDGSIYVAKRSSDDENDKNTTPNLLPNLWKISI